MNESSHKHPVAAGKSSFGLIDLKPVFAALPLAESTTILDLACGAGAYTLELARRLPQSTIHGLDLWDEGIAELRRAAAREGLANIKAIRADAGRRLPFADSSIDLCLAATILHDLVETTQAAAALTEAARILRPGGILAVIEFIKKDGPPGPPAAIRLDPAELATLVVPHGFLAQPPQSAGEHLYLMRFVRSQLP